MTQHQKRDRDEHESLIWEFYDYQSKTRPNAKKIKKDLNNNINLNKSITGMTKIVYYYFH